MLKWNIPKIKTKNKRPRLGPIKIIFHFKNNTNNFISNYNIGYKEILNSDQNTNFIS